MGLREGRRLSFDVVSMDEGIDCAWFYYLTNQWCFFFFLRSNVGNQQDGSLRWWCANPSGGGDSLHIWRFLLQREQCMGSFNVGGWLTMHCGSKCSPATKLDDNIAINKRVWKLFGAKLVVAISTGSSNVGAYLYPCWRCWFGFMLQGW